MSGASVEFTSVIRGHHVYKSKWTPMEPDKLICYPETREEALDSDPDSIGVYCTIPELGLVGHLENFPD